MRGQSAVLHATLLCLLLACFVSTAFARADSKPDASTAVERGRQTFNQSCAVCHGKRADGDGSAAPALTPHPSNLTTLSRRHGRSAAELIEATIRGTDPVVAHGTPGMMVWGAVFLANANGNEAVADARIHDLMAFVESVQVK